MQFRSKIWIIITTIKMLAATESIKDDAGISPRIIGGDLAVPDEFKFVVGLFSVMKDESAFLCSGSALNQHTVLTAGHCVLDSIGIVVYVNCINLTACTNSRTGTGFIHPKYRLMSGIVINDVGLVRTKEALDSQEYIQLAKPAPIYMKCTAVGFGSTDKIRTENDLLYKLDIRRVIWCYTILPAELFSYVLCAKVEGGKSIYVGDSGGPLICNGKQVGIAHMMLGKDVNQDLYMQTWTVPDMNVKWVAVALSVRTELHLVPVLCSSVLYAILS